MSNKDWKSPVDPDARIAKLKDGRTHLAHKPEHVVDLDSSAIAADKGYHSRNALVKLEDTLINDELSLSAAPFDF